MDTDLRQLIIQYMAKKRDMQLATVAAGRPWICTVYFVHDDDLNLYWMSARERQHSVEIVNDPKVAVTIVRDNERKQALQIIGNAREVTDEELDKVHELYQGKYGPKEYDLAEMKQHKSTGRAYWILKPTEISLWDEINFLDSPKQKYDVNKT